MGRWGTRSLETRVGRESSASRSRARLHSGGTHVGGAQRGSCSDPAGGTASRARAAKSPKLGQEKCEHPRWTHPEQAQHCTDPPHQATPPAHTEQGKMGPGPG